uniref:Solute carrier family 16 member 9b n=1 Tax=Cyprinus carpio carpio TaxID=630221 RepID=A0A9J8ASQ8_CYPCA
MSAQNTKQAPDGGWGWAIVVASFMGQLLAYGSPQSVGVLYPEWLNTFQDSKGMTAWVGSLVSGVGLIASPVCSACVVNFGARPVTIFSGVMVSGGLMLSAFAPNVQFLIFSYGIVVGTSIGGFLYATVQNEFIALFGLDGCLLLIGCFALNIIACAGLMRPLHLPAYYLKQRAALAEKTEEKVLEKAPVVEDPIKKNQSVNVLITGETKERKSLVSYVTLVRLVKKKQKEYSEYLHSTAELLQNRVFLATCVSLFAYCLGAYTPLLFLEDLAQTEGLISGISTIPLVSIMSIAAGVGKLLLGVMMDIHWMNSIFLYSFTLLGTGVVLLIIPVTKNYTGLRVISALLGFFSGNWSVIPYVTTKVVGMDRLTEAYGILMFFGGFSIMLGPPVAGWIYDWMHSYDLAFYFSGSFVLLGGAGLFLAAVCCRNNNQEETSTPDTECINDYDKVATVA